MGLGPYKPSFMLQPSRPIGLITSSLPPPSPPRPLCHQPLAMPAFTGPAAPRVRFSSASALALAPVTCLRVYSWLLL